jgi:hypothetical protein
MTSKAHLLLAAAAALGLAGAAQAQTQAQTTPRPLDLRLSGRAASAPAAPLGTVGRQTPRPAPDLANPLDPLAPTVVQTGAMQSVVFAKTAIDHRFTRREDVTGQFGFLCGLKPGHNESGGAAAYGVDPHGRFVGAKLSIAFR